MRLSLLLSMSDKVHIDLWILVSEAFNESLVLRPVTSGKGAADAVRKSDTCWLFRHLGDALESLPEPLFALSGSVVHTGRIVYGSPPSGPMHVELCEEVQNRGLTVSPPMVHVHCARLGPVLGSSVSVQTILWAAAPIRHRMGPSSFNFHCESCRGRADAIKLLHEGFSVLAKLWVTHAAG